MLESWGQMKLVLMNNENIKTFTNNSCHIELEVECLGVQHITLVAYAGR